MSLLGLEILESLRERFGIEEKNSAIASRIIKDCFMEGLIKEDDPDSNSRRFKKYVPFWVKLLNLDNSIFI